MKSKYKKVSQMTKKGHEFIKYQNGAKAWYLNGERHREDGPAIEFSNGYKTWHLNDKIISLEMKSKDPKVKKLQEYMKMSEVLEK